MLATAAGRNQVAFVDDDPHFLETVRVWQSSVEMEERATSDPDEAVRWVQHDEVNIVVCDLKMPRLNGVAVLELIRQVDPHIPLVLLTGFEPDDEERQRLDQAHVEVCSKINDLPKLLETLSERDPGNPADQMVQLQSRIHLLEKVNREWVDDLVAQLEAIPNLEKALISGSTERIAVSDIIEDIKALTPNGIKYIRLWKNALRSLRSMGRKV